MTIHEILDAENHLGRLLDYGVILPHARAVYEHAASALNTHQLLDMLRDGSPVYAWPYEARQAWTTTRTPLRHPDREEADVRPCARSGVSVEPRNM